MRAALLWLSLLALPVLPQKGKYESFEKVDPYTEGDSARLELLGYERYDSFPWHKAVRTADVQETLGGADTLFIETAHFKIASTLGSYTIPSDRRERDRLRDGIAAMEEKLGKLKASRKKIDPWMRAHLYAQMLERTYATFAQDFGIAGDVLKEGEVWPGQRSKLRVLMTERKSEFQRYVSGAFGVEVSEYFWTAYPDGSLFFGGTIEPIRERWHLVQGIPLDTQLQGHLQTGAVAALLGGYADSFYGVPVWFLFGLAHWYTRQVDERWTSANGQTQTKEWKEEDGEWYRRVYDLAKIEFYVDAPTMFGWGEYPDMNERDHLIVWSRVDYLMQLEEGDRKLFLDVLCQRPPPGASRDRHDHNVQRSTEALQRAFGLTPEEFESNWLEYVLQEYKRRK